MNRLLLLGLFFVQTIAFWGCSNQQQVKPLKPLSVATGEWKPYVGEDLPNYGPLAEMMSAILADLGYVPVFKFYDWGIVETHLQSGYPIMAFPYLRAKEREAAGFRYSDSLIELDYALFYYKEDSATAKSAENIDSLVQLRNTNGNIARIRGYSKLPPITSDSSYTEVASAIDGFNALINTDDSIKYLLEAKLVGLRALQSQDLLADRDDFGYLGQSTSLGSEDTTLVKSSSFHILLSPKAPDDLFNSLNEAINDSLNAEFFRSLESKIRSGGTTQNTALLASSPQESLYGYSDSVKADPQYILPRNTRVLIMDWSGVYENPIEDGQLANETGRTRIKVINGPLQGKVMWVANKYLTLEP